MTTKFSTIASSTTPSKTGHFNHQGAKTPRKAVVKPAFARNDALRGFTLIEILVVIVIISILVAMAFPVYNTVLYRARATDALSMINQVRVALNAYQNDYGDWPPPILTNANTNTFGNSLFIASTNAKPATNQQVWTSLYQTLTATGPTNTLATNNSRRTVYMQIPIKYLNNQTNPTNSTTFFDPWQREYNLEVDLTGSNVIAGLPQTTNGSVGPNTNMTINASLAIWSYGNYPTNAANYIINWK